MERSLGSENQHYIMQMTIQVTFIIDDSFLVTIPIEFNLFEARFQMEKVPLKKSIERWRDVNKGGSENVMSNIESANIVLMWNRNQSTNSIYQTTTFFYKIQI